MTRRFIIMAHARSGSTAVQTALDTHPRIRCWAEVLHQNAGSFGFPFRQIAEGEPVGDNLESEVFAPQPGQAAIGFRALDNHFLRIESGRKYLTEVNEKGGVDLVFLERRHLLDAVLSEARASRARRYVFNRVAVPDDYYEPFEVDAADLAARVGRVRRHLARLKKMTRSLRSLSLIYEDFEDDVTIGAGRIVDFLGLEQMPLAPKTTKIGRVRPSEVKNLDELLAAFDSPELSAEFDRSYWMGR